MKIQKIFRIFFVALAVVTYPGTAQAACTLDGFSIGGTCRYVITSASSNGTSDQDISYDSATSSESSLVVSSLPDYSYFDGQSEADLSSGALKAYVDTIIGGGANASWRETVIFTLPVGVTSIEIPVTVRLEGVNTHRPTASYNNISLNFQAASYGLPGSDPSHFDVFSVQKYCGFNSEFTSAICKEGEVAIEYTDTLTIWSDVYYIFDFGIGVGGSAITQDFGHTATFSWVLPEDVKFVSSSGVFMSAAANAVPESSTWAMMLLGIGLIGGLLRRSRQRAHMACC